MRKPLAAGAALIQRNTLPYTNRLGCDRTFMRAHLFNLHRLVFSLALGMIITTGFVLLYENGFLFRWQRLPPYSRDIQALVLTTYDSVVVRDRQGHLALWVAQDDTWTTINQSDARRMTRDLAQANAACRASSLALRGLPRPAQPFRICLEGIQTHADGWTRFAYALDAQEQLWQWSFTRTVYDYDRSLIPQILVGGTVLALITYTVITFIAFVRRI